MINVEYSMIISNIGGTPAEIQTQNNSLKRGVQNELGYIVRSKRNESCITSSYHHMSL